jgi:hypothetical protein
MRPPIASMRLPSPSAVEPGPLTSLLVKLAEDLADDLADALQRLEVILGLVIVLLELLDALAKAAHSGVHLFVLEELFPVLGDRSLAALGL